MMPNWKRESNPDKEYKERKGERVRGQEKEEEEEEGG